MHTKSLITYINILVFIIISFILFISATVFINAEKTIQNEQMKNNLKSRIEVLSSTFEEKLNKLESYALIANNYFYDDENLILKEINTTKLLPFINTGFYQARILNSDGKELLVYELDEITKEFKKVNHLEDKSSTSYFKEIANKSIFYNKVHFSEINLNVENGKIQEPHLPTIRTMAKLRNDNDFDDEFIIIIYNFNFETLLSQLFKMEFFDVYLIDDEGFITYSLDKKNSFSKQLNKNEKLKNLIDKQTLYTTKNIDISGKNYILLVKPKDEYLEQLESQYIDLKFTIYSISLLLSILLSLIIYFILKNAFNRLFINLKNILEKDEIAIEESFTEFNYIYKKLIVLQNKLSKNREKNKKALEEEAKKIRKIFNSQSSICFITTGLETTEINNKFFKLFDYIDLSDFKNSHKCISELFQENKEEQNTITQYKNDKLWIDYIKENKESTHTVTLKDKENKIKIFTITVSIFNKNLNQYIINLNDITLLREQSKILRFQNRLATMGEMISMIAHQWRQPLTTINSINSKLSIKMELDMLTNIDIENAIKKQNELISYLSNTIEDFRNFFRNDDSSEKIKVNDLVFKPFRMIKPSFDEKNIEFIVEFDNSIDKEKEIMIQISKFNQVLINLYKNALEQLSEKNIKNPFVKVSLSSFEDNILMEIEDNAGGIPENIISNIFEPYFSTKGKNGTGLGLYMCKIIIENHLKGKINVSNTNNGACFKIVI